ncbi:VOC family protein [Salinicoccus hispanicus]|uniref:Glyoxalase n=1 Tax=Salinicoccus hispanicus TaxID=157225 RepID=A0A6N8U2F5_9STAP|nr:VOC family protein [Salinicoccus hispanicus]MXQ50555.1 glyoxalase [Salinicoccus hispanicus]
MTFHTPPAIYVSHVKINVSDMESALAFYTRLLGFSILEQNDREVHLTADGKTCFLTLNVPDHPVEKKKTTGLYHFAILLSERSDLAALVIHLARNNVALGAADHSVSEAIYLNDPDGNGIEVYVDRPSETWLWRGDNVQMTTEPLDFEEMSKTLRPDQKWEKMPESAIMGHLHLHVSDLSPAVIFYTTGLGLEIVSEFMGSAVFMSTSRYHHHVAVNAWNGTGVPQPEPGSVGLDTFTLAYPDQDALDAAVKRLSSLGYDVSDEDHSMISVDPSGNKVKMVTR